MLVHPPFINQNNARTTDQNLINNTQLLDKANNVHIRPKYRHIASSIRALAEHIYAYIDPILHLLLHNIHSLITDNNDFHRKLNDKAI